MKLLRTTPQERVIPKGKLKETFVTAMGKISVRAAFHGFIRSGPDATSMVTAMKMMVMLALAMMPIMVMLVMAMIMRPPLADLPVGPRSLRGVCRNREYAACDRGHWGLW